MGATVGDLLRARVRLHGIELGRPVDVILDRERRRALGLEVRCGDGERRFLPLAVARFSGDTVAISSSLLLLDASELRFYTERGATLTSLRNAPVHHAGRLVGSLDDLVVKADGEIEALLVRTKDGPLQLPYDDRVALAPAGVRAAS
jgi:hypothetical protein